MIDFERETHNPLNLCCPCPPCRVAWCRRVAGLYATIVRHQIALSRP